MTSSISCQHFVGLLRGIRHNASFSDETTIVYPAGHSLVLYNTMEKRQRFISATQGSGGISAVAMSPSKRFIAVAERGDKGFVTVHDLRTLRKRKHLDGDVASKEFTALGFSMDNELLIGLSRNDGVWITVWRWAKGKVVASMLLRAGLANYLECSFSPFSTALVATLSPERVDFVKNNDAKLELVPCLESPAADTPALTCMAWLKSPPEHLLVVGNAGGGVLFYADGEPLGKALQAHEKSLTCIQALSNGFVTACDDGSLHIFSKVSESSSIHESFSLTHTWRLDQQSLRVSCISLSPSEDSLCVVLDDSQIFVVPTLSTAAKNDDIKPICGFSHGPGPITGLDTCVRKPLIVTCGLDCTVRVWNYVTHALEQIKKFAEEPHSVAFHPSGLHVVVGFTDKLRLLNLLMGDLRVYREVPIKLCREVQFSEGGNFFSAVNGNIITVFDFYTCEKVVDLRGHNSKVKALYWGNNDTSIVSCGQDGAVYQWDWYEGKRLAEYVQKGTVFNCAICTENSVISVGNDRMMKELELPELQVIKDFDVGTNLSQVVMSNSHHLLFAGTCQEDQPSCVRAYPFPLTNDHVDFPCMGGPITRMRVTSDDQYLIVTDDTGCMCVFDIRDRQERQRSGVSQPAAGLRWSEEMLVTKSDLEEKGALRNELKSKVEELQLHNEYQLRLKDMSYSEKIKEVTEKYMQDLEQDKNRYELLREEKNDMEMEYEERLKQMESKHQHQLQDLENTYQQKIMAEVERYQQLLHERNLQHETWETQRKMLTETHERYMQELMDDFEQKLEEDQQLRVQLQEEKSDLQREFHESRSQLEDDVDTEVDHLRTRYESQLTAEREATLRFKGENGIMKKKFTVLTKDIEDQKEEIKALLEKEKELNEQIKALEREITAHKREIKSRDDMIGEKEKKIYELKKKNQELEKFKFVLDYKIKELKRQIEPRETEIANMKSQIQEMDHELEQFHKSNAQLDVMIGDLRTHLGVRQEQILDQRKRIGDQKAVARTFKSELHECAQHIQDPARLKNAIEVLHRQHLQKDAPATDLDLNIEHEYNRHREYLERSLANLQQQFGNASISHRKENMRLMHENMALIRTINTQRESNAHAKRGMQAAAGGQPQ